MYSRLAKLAQLVRPSQYQHHIVYSADPEYYGFTKLPIFNKCKKKRSNCGRSSGSSQDQQDGKCEYLGERPPCKPGPVKRPKSSAHQCLPLYNECEGCEDESRSCRKK